MACTETGWKKNFPADGIYWWRRSEIGVPERTVGVCRVASGSVYVIGRAGARRVPGDSEFLGPISPSDAEQLIQLRKSTIEACLKELREALPMGRIEIRADMTESGQIHITILNAFLDAVPYGSTLADAMNQARAALNPDLQKETQ